jgi:hypothetical protein
LWFGIVFNFFVLLKVLLRGRRRIRGEFQKVFEENFIFGQLPFPGRPGEKK